MSSNQDSRVSNESRDLRHHSRHDHGNVWLGPYHHDVRHLASIKHLIPPKRSTDGSWKHTLYVPAWTDPDWEDTGPTREKTEWSVSDGLASRMRPAILARDKILNPTKYAERFGVFCGRTDGRSRTSPTRASSRQLFPSGDVRTGKDLFDRLKKLAVSRGRHLDDFLAEERIDMQELDPSDEIYVRKYEEMIIDEFWQGALFGDLTMDEMHAENYFTMGDARSNLNGPLHQLLRRDRWIDTSQRGTKSSEPRLAYNFNGERGECDPRTNDKLWEAMQPALQLATRFVETKDTFTTALQDVSNRFYIDPALDVRKMNEQKKYPKFSFRRHVDMDDPMLIPSARDMRELSGFEPSKYTWKALLRTLRFAFVSSHYSDESVFTYPGSSGVTWFEQLHEPDSQILITVSAELAWPLLVDNYSNSEKLITSYMLATTIAHELMHAWIGAHCKWLYNPAAWGIKDPTIQSICRTLCKELYPNRGYENAPEPHFEDDPLDEAGHAFEHHVIGGGAWPLSSAMHNRAFVPFIGEFAGIAIQSKWPDGVIASLSHPGVRADLYSHFMRTGDIDRLFRQDFWETSVARYGMAAVRDISRKPHKVIYAAEESRSNYENLSKLNFLKEEDRKWIMEYLDDLVHNGQRTLWAYLRNLLMEGFQFDLMIQRFQQDLPLWHERSENLSDRFRGVFLMLLEYKSCRILLSGWAKERKEAAVDEEYAEWDDIATMCEKLPDEFSKDCENDFRRTVLSISSSEHRTRIVRAMIDLVRVLEFERMVQESMLCEIYQLPSRLRRLYTRNIYSHYDYWKKATDVIGKEIDAIGRMAGEIEPYLLVWKNEWKAQFQSLGTAFKNIRRLLDLDESKFDGGWRDLLSTVPMLRKCRRKSHERWFFLAKKEMLNLSGEDLDDLVQFKGILEKATSLESWKIVLPETGVDEQGLAQRWAGLLDDVLEKKKSGQELVSVFSTEPVRKLVENLEKQGRDAEESMLRRAAEGELDEAEAAARTLQQLAESESMKPPSIAPKVTEPHVENQGITLSEPKPSLFGRVSTLIGTPPSSFQPGNPSGAFSTYKSHSGGFPSQKRGNRPSWAPLQLAQEVNLPDKGRTKRKSISGIMPHPYAIRETISRDLLNVVEMDVAYTPPDVFSSEAPRAKRWAMGQPGIQGEGSLGDIDDAWERQLREEMAEYEDQMELDDDEDDDFQETAEGSAFVARALDGGSESRSESSRSGGSSGFIGSGYDSTSVSGTDTSLDTSADLVGRQKRGLKRRAFVRDGASKTAKPRAKRRKRV